MNGEPTGMAAFHELMEERDRDDRVRSFFQRMEENLPPGGETPLSAADLRRRRDRLRDELEPPVKFMHVAIEPLTVERRAELVLELADVEARLLAAEAGERRAAFPLHAIKRGWPRRAIQGALAHDLETDGPYYAALRRFQAEDTRVGRILALAGPVGRGKTVAAAWGALQEYLRCGHSAPRFITAGEFFRSSKYGEDRERLLREHELVLDDLGMEYADAKGAYQSDFDELVDRFYSGNGTLTITTNIRFATPQGRDKAKAPASEVTFQERYGQRVADRVRECGTWVLDTGPSRRKAQP